MAVLKMWGNSAAVRIPATYLEESKFSIDEPLVITAEEGRIVIESSKPSYNLADLVAQITPENTHGFAGHSQRVGAEDIEW
ncbi:MULTISPECIES: AbrB/MazE/SpoVT family DNA-binding domain-containing protein [Xanthomonas]|uniref:AbrB/MazE/SpoVT family DNA-binding domain-containing protein n=1 Tax=Xanthomonas TaxID=338 RepID=UPI00036ED24C|nr:MULTISPECIES: AbrB/MazE/SpoVT family DNA-binding domain-containing protein [Xanthomonas]WVK05117.1 AbrB/MazE/SpoVT family DNA-binding domain-containing protein [Xanthomonas campestris pv. olitorii]CAD7737937.1 hypothetical protein LMG31886_26790 [Xanthomonas hydrangeae]ALS95187.1 PbsX family transcriptional regulator [Xanthomonas oryzae pv. oryzae]AUI90274.1 PbsX family transcriptional regulator [Xanthomonas oryzae pv. oryzae]AUI93951.1 PbsX family transcriptional regulator [Xanthomonas ory